MENRELSMVKPTRFKQVSSLKIFIKVQDFVFLYPTRIQKITAAVVNKVE